SLTLLSLLAFGAQGQAARDYRDIYADLALFDDDFAYKHKIGVKTRDINKKSHHLYKEVALQQLNRQYETSYINNTYRALLSPYLLGEQLSIGDGYSKYENITGVYLPVGQHVVLVDGIAEGKVVQLVVPNWLRYPPNE